MSEKIDLDFKSRNEFRKGMEMRRIDEDPTYLSFMILFHYNDHSSVGHSPLLDGTAEKYLRNVIRDDVGEAYANNVKNFVRVLRRVNTEMPWFWQGMKGLETALNYGDMSEPWRGAEKPTIELECLEENVELTAIGLMDLYKRSCYDFERYVEVVPKNLREFSFDVIVSEVRVFQKDTNARNMGLTDDEDSVFGGNSSNQTANSITVYDTQLTNKDFTSADVTPFIRLRFTHCEFDINSIADYFADLSKNPELKKPNIKIKWGTCRQIDQKLGANLFNESAQGSAADKSRVEKASDVARLEDGAGIKTSQKYLKALRGRTIGKVESAIEGFKDAASAQKDSIVNSFANPDQPGIVKNLLDKAESDLLGGLLLDNVHGLGSRINNIATAVKTGSLNAIGNVVGDMLGSKNPLENGGVGGLGNMFNEGIDSTPDGNLNDNVYDPTAGDNDNLSPDNVHGNTTPDTDGPINENVHE